MPREKLDERNVLTLAPPETGRLFYWDESKHAPPWFGVRVNAPVRGEVYRGYVLGFRLRERERLLTLGKVGVKKLKAARKAAHDALADIERGVDPIAKKRAARKRPTNTVGDLASDWLASDEAKLWRPKTRAEFERLVDAEIDGTDLAKMDPKKVTRADIRRLLDKIHADSPSTANHTRAVLRLMFAWALEHERVDNIPTFPKKLVKYVPRERVLTTTEIRRVWNVLDGRMGDGSPLPEGESPLSGVGEAFRLLLMTAQRAREVLSMRWADVDLDAAWWTIPSERKKEKRVGRVPLTHAAVDVLRGLENDSDYVFPSPRPTDACPWIASYQKMSTRLWKRSGVTDATIHDFRRTAATFMGDVGVPRQTIELVLNHATRGAQATAIYDRSRRDAEKRAAMEKWGRKLTAILATNDADEREREKARSNVSEFRR